MHADSSEINPYLQQEVLSASPPRLRWLLVRKAEELCGVVTQMWADDQAEYAGQWIIRIRDILVELLGGVQDPANPVSENVADFYVFLLQLLAEVEQSRKVERMSVLRELLSIEAETWRMVAEKIAQEESNSLESSEKPIFVPSASNTLESSGGFSLEV